MAERHAKREALKLAILATQLAMSAARPPEVQGYIDVLVHVTAAPLAERPGFVRKWLP